MYKISELIGKQAITLIDAGQQGVILGVFFDKALTKCKGFSLLSGDDENIFYVDFKNFSSLSSDAAVIRSDLNLKQQPLEPFSDSPINLPAFNQDGKALGVIRDINMEAADIVSFITDNGSEIPAGTLLSRSESIVVFNDTGEPIKVKKAVKKEKTEGGEKKSETKAVADLKPDDSKTAKIAPSDAPKAPFGRLRATDNITGSAARQGDSLSRLSNPLNQNNPLINKYSFLLGKRLQRSIYAAGGRLIAKENDLVTEKIISLAKENGKLAAIALHSL